MAALNIPKNNIQLPRSESSINIFMLIQELLSEQKQNSKKYGKFAVLAMVDTLNMQYQKHLDDWAQKAEELKATMAREFQELKDSFNTGGWLTAIIAPVVGALVGFALGGPAGAKLGFVIGGLIAGGGILGDKLGSGNKVFFDSKKEIDQLKFQKREDDIKINTNESKHIQDKANIKQGEISRTMQIEFETIQQLETAMSNMIVSLLKLFGRTADMMGRG